MMRKFLPSVSQLSIFQVVVVDNGSTDNSVEVLQTEFPHIRTIILDSNFGFTGGYNRALEILKGSFDYYILLNSDVQVEQDWDIKLIQFLKENSSIAAVQPKILSYKNEGYFDYAGAGGGFVDGLGYPYCRGRIFNSIEMDTGQYDDTVEVDWASGACMAIRSNIFHTVGRFDESFFAHMEEIDLCWRIKKMGLSVYYLGTSKVWHVGGGTLDRSNPWKTFLNFRNNLLMLYKNVSPNRFLLIYLVRLVLDLLASVIFLARGSFRDGHAVFEAHIEFHKMKSKLEKTLPPKQKNKNEIQHFRKSILWDYYIRGKKTFSEL
ncbi:glycosyltransferase family 2 protein [Aquiflexum sp. TKW24L]|nr:glycosyltransferase family 2 protein [Aquiflexum sp. TKW24L]